MKLKRILGESSDIFAAVITCEHCGFEEEVSGLHNTPEFRQVTLPSKSCPKCGKSSLSPRNEPTGSDDEEDSSSSSGEGEGPSLSASSDQIDTEKLASANLEDIFGQ